MTKRELVDMFKNIIFPKQAEDLLKINYEGLGELDKREFLRDTLILIMLAEKGLKSEQEPRWIPVTERLPEEDTNVLVTMVKGRHKVMYGKYDRQLQKFCVGNYIRSKYVTAWMPLPEPYKEDKE